MAARRRAIEEAGDPADGPSEMFLGAGGRVMYARSEGDELDKAIAALAKGDTVRAARVLERLRKQIGFGAHRNPPLIVYGNPPIGVKGNGSFFRGGVVTGTISKEVHAILYRHAEDGRPYRHDFEHPTAAYAVERGGQRDVLLSSLSGEPIWQDF